MSSPAPADLPRIDHHLRQVLAAHPEGLSEFQLLNRLREHIPLFQGDRADPVLLFQQHFILFHCLYRLQQTLVEAQEGWLEISPLRICLYPGPGPRRGQQLDQPDPLRAYYLNLEHLFQTGRDEVNTLLTSFWSILSRRDRRSEALQVLGLSDPVADSEIRRRYRQLVMRHHPDRGGDTRRLQLLNAAIASLLPDRA